MNPAFLYGESVFTSFSLVEGKIPLRQRHFARLAEGVQAYFGPLENIADFLKNLERAVDEAIHGLGNEYIRVTIYAGQRETLAPNISSANALKFHIFVKDSMVEARPLSLAIFDSPFTPFYPKYKMGSYMPHLYFKKLAKAQGADDALFKLANIVTEASTSSIFFVKEGDICTSLSQNVFPGIMREWCLQNMNVTERNITVGELNKFDFAFTANAVSHFKLVKKIDDLIYRKIDVTLLKNMLDKFKEETL